jgi:hypothetical protein
MIALTLSSRLAGHDAPNGINRVGRFMVNEKLSRTLGLVGMRAFEGQAWNSPGARAVEEMVWERSGGSAAFTKRPARKTLWARLRNALRAAMGAQAGA